MLEIERKFLLNEIPENIKDCKKKEILQGYFKQNKKNIRLRKCIDYKSGRKYTTYTMTRKQGKGLVRQEDEKKISEKMFTEYRESAKKYYIEKTRYLYDYKGYLIEIDQFHNKLDGLWMAEVEFNSVEDSQNFVPPIRCNKEITGKKEGNNSYIAIYGMDDIIKKTKYQSIITKFQLKSFYNQEAKKYSQTRKKHWSDADIILQAIQSYPKSKLNIVEIGCGSGRFLNHLGSIKNKKINYIGVDISENLIEEAKKIDIPQNINANFICKNMVKYLSECKQESVDIIVGIASFQHLTSVKDRFLSAKYIYKCLDYDGIVLMTNRSFSEWMIKTHWKAFIKSIWHKIINPVINEWNNLMIPWKSGDIEHKRFYHIFTKGELKNIFSQSGFVINKIEYLTKEGKPTNNRRKGNNTLLSATKTIFIS